MYLSKLVEQADVAELYRNPAILHVASCRPSRGGSSPLEADHPQGDIRRRQSPTGCRWRAAGQQLSNPERCVTGDPEFRPVATDHRAACHSLRRSIASARHQGRDRSSQRTVSAADVECRRHRHLAGGGRRPARAGSRSNGGSGVPVGTGGFCSPVATELQR